MSFLLRLDEDKLEQIVPLLPKYEEAVVSAEAIFKLEGKRLEEVARTLPHYQSSYDRQYQELKALEEWVNNIKDKKMARLWKKYTEGYARQLTARDIQAYVAGEKEIVELNQIIIEISLIKNNLSSIVEALKQMGWMISHMTKLRISEMQDAIL